jgi:hypothetical protein
MTHDEHQPRAGRRDRIRSPAHPFGMILLAIVVLGALLRESS